jgi:cephalosporin hydroxylase
MTPVEKSIIDAFHTLYYCSNHTWNAGHTTWIGIPCFQNPLDMWILQEIIFETKPTVIIECGSALGGGSLFFAHMMDNAGIKEGKVIAIDTEGRINLYHKRVLNLTGRSTSTLVLKWINEEIRNDDKVMVVLDSDHTTENVMNEIRIYAPIITPGCYMVVMDSNLGGNPIHIPEIGQGPMAAIEQFMKENKEFEIDREREKFYFTFCPNGWLRRK